MLIPDAKSLSVATALRDDVPMHGWGQPTRSVLDGAWRFNAEQNKQLQWTYFIRRRKGRKMQDMCYV